MVASIDCFGRPPTRPISRSNSGPATGVPPALKAWLAALTASCARPDLVVSVAVLLRLIRLTLLAVRAAIFSGKANVEEVVARSGERADAIFRKPWDFDGLLAWIA